IGRFSHVLASYILLWCRPVSFYTCYLFSSKHELIPLIHSSVEGFAEVFSGLASRIFQAPLAILYKDIRNSTSKNGLPADALMAGRSGVCFGEVDYYTNVHYESKSYQLLHINNIYVLTLGTRSCKLVS